MVDYRSELSIISVLLIALTLFCCDLNNVLALVSYKSLKTLLEIESTKLNLNEKPGAIAGAKLPHSLGIRFYILISSRLL
jgi:hypothetical protein